MRFSVAFTTVLAAVAYAAPLAAPVEDSDVTALDVEQSAEQIDDITARDVDMLAQDENEESGVEKRQIIAGVVVAVLTAVGSDLAMEAADAAITASANLIKAITNWTTARENFTKNTVKTMYSKLPSGMSAAVCYNMGYTFANNKHSSPVKAKLTANVLNTDYDCMYMAKGNTFTANGDGGYINLATQYASSCKYDSTKKTLTC